jgi:50S ribosomal subunit-associated GTPase HflX
MIFSGKVREFDKQCKSECINLVIFNEKVREQRYFWSEREN